MRRRWLIPAVLCGGCVEGFDGSNVQIDLNPATPPQAPIGRMPQGREFATNGHFRLYGIHEVASGDALFELRRFEIHRVVDLTSPCFIDAGPNVPFPGLHVSQYALKMSERTGITDVMAPPAGATMEQQIEQATAVQRMRNVEALAGDTGIKVVTSASESVYPPVDAACGGGGLPPPACIDEPSNQRRLELCQDAWTKDPLLFEGTDRVLTAPLNGTTFGFVAGLNPVSPVPVGGAQLFVEDALDRVDEYAIYFQIDGQTDPGMLFLAGRPQAGATRGVTHVHLDSPLFPGIVTAELAIFADLDEDDVHF
ncbi:MAG TPA: hypothetical protein VNO30_18175 [Kofleriaceae bacterium]|nr:hypothetical protein [Kofleriaceae bacterium]